MSTRDPKPGVEAPNIKQGEPARSPRVDVWALIGSALMAVILVLVNVISFRRYERWDITEERLFTLSERTLSLLAGLDRDVDVYVFMAQGEPTYQDLRELLTRYGAHTEHVHAEYVDPDREPTKFRVLAEKYGVRVGLQENGQSEAELAVLVVSGDKRWSITRDDLVDVDLDSLESGSPEGAKVNVKTEQALSGAIVQVTSGRATTVCIADGHGEWTLEGGGERTLVGLRDELKRENVVLEALTTRGKSALPKTCDALFVLGPQKAYTDEESAAIKGYLEQGGSVLLALDPVIRGEELVPTGLEGLAESYGVHVDQDVMVELDPEQLLSQSPVEHVLVTHFTDHRLVRPVAALGAPLVSALSRSLSLPAGSKAEALFKSSDKAYGEVKLSELTAGDDMKPSQGDVTGPLVLGAAVDTLAEAGDTQAAPKKTGGRLVVLGDSDFVAPELLGQPQLANVDLVASLTGYLTEREALVSIAPRKAKAQAVLMSADDLFDVFLRVVVLMPLAVLVLGVGVYLQRQK